DAAADEATEPTLQDSVAAAVQRIAGEVAKADRAEAAAERRERALGGEGDDERRVERLLDATNSRLAGPEMRRRRSALAHLKAAVAATRAEGGRPKTNPDDAVQPYRDDLAAVVKPTASEQPQAATLEDAPAEAPVEAAVEDAQFADDMPQADEIDARASDDEDAPLAADAAEAPAEYAPAEYAPAEYAPADYAHDDGAEEDDDAPVRPRRPAAAEAAADRPRVAPLMLVSEQRVDAEDAPVEGSDASDTPVRPRRVTKGRLAIDGDGGEPAESGMVKTDAEAAGIFADSTAFADFAEKMGAEGLSDLLECAAAYSAYVEGRPHFSHPQIMRVVRDGIEGQGDLSREESLRTFGQLLRQGKIRKVSRGQFTISKSSRYKPEPRSAAQ
ncbi:MAG: hypothetical protein AAF646_10540, partial [Pseudomonadota bacterium]